MGWSVVDLEWDGNHPDHPLLLIGWRGHAYTEDEAQRAGVFDEMADPSITKVAFTKSDHRWLWEHGYEVRGPFHDVQVMAWTYDERTDLDLESVVYLYTGQTMDKRLRKAGGKIHFLCDDGELVPIAEAPLDELRRYNEGDLMGTELSYLELTDRLKRSGRYEMWLERNAPYSDVLLRMELAGLPLDVWRTKVARRELTKDVEARAEDLFRTGQLPEGFNLASRDQLADYLFQKEYEWKTRYAFDKETMTRIKAGEWPDSLPLDFEPTKVGRIYVAGVRRLPGRGLHPTKKAPKCERRDVGDGSGCGHESDAQCHPSVSAKLLKVEHGGDPWVTDYCEYALRVKGLQFLNLWLEKVKDGRLYANFKQTGTDTGRLSSTDPNLQQIPSRTELGRKFRTLFRAPPGRVFIHADQSQIEPRVSAHYSQDEFLLDIFERDLNLYEELTERMLGARYPEGTPEYGLTKQCFLASEYGAKPPKIRALLAEQGFRFTRARVTTAHEALQDTCRGFWEWKDRAILEAEERGYVETLGGHRRHIGWLDPDMRWKSENQTVASIISGSAADIMQGTMMVIDRELPTVRLVAAVHDELLGELASEDADESTRHTFQAAGETGHGYVLDGVKLKFKAKYVKSWAEAK